MKGIYHLWFSLVTLLTFQACTSTKNIAKKPQKQTPKAFYENIPVSSTKTYDPTYFLKDMPSELILDPPNINPTNPIEAIQSYRLRAQQLRNLLDSSLNVVDSLEKSFEAISKLKPTSQDENQKVIKALKNELADLKGENLMLSFKVSKAQRAHQNALFALQMQATPGRIKREKYFSAAIRARNVSMVKVNIYLTRALEPTDEVVIKLMDEANNEIPLQSIKGSFNQPNMQLMLTPDANQRTFFKGKYTIYLILNNSKQKIQEQTIGMTTFTLK
ncbi:hypothetical protein BKI52_24170 [marine bacterium AO1-C]|nr:hypothetical protein BKI52_24170 [marine bacterium AO1-C]